MTAPFLMSGIDAFLERFDAETRDRFDKGLLRARPQFEVGGDHLFHHVDDLGVGHGWPEQHAKSGMLVRASAQGHLKELLAVLLDAKDADMAHVVMATGVDASGDIDVQPAKVAGKAGIAEASRQLLGDGYR